MPIDTPVNPDFERLLADAMEALANDGPFDLLGLAARTQGNQEQLKRLVETYVCAKLFKDQTIDLASLEKLGEWALPFVKECIQRGQASTTQASATGVSGIAFTDTDRSLTDVETADNREGRSIKRIPVPISESTMMGRYRVNKKLGGGGMGSVYSAFDTILGRYVALKVPHFSRANDPEAVKRFLREAKAMATLSHPNLCQVYDVGQYEGGYFLTMALVRGKTLAELLAERRLTTSEAIDIAWMIALALNEAHRAGVIHRDLKPANIMVDERGQPVVIDFGLAKGGLEPEVTQADAIIGTPAYMSPEHLRGHWNEIGPASDIFSLGTILYLMLTGQLPFLGSGWSVLAQIQYEQPIPPSMLNPEVSTAMESICLKCLAKPAADRFATMAQLAEALESARNSPSTPIDRMLVHKDSRSTVAHGRKYDLFISYAPMDDGATASSSSGIVTRLIEDLAWRLCQLNGRSDEISFAISHDPLHEHADNSARHQESELILIVGSQGYLKGIWQRDELAGLRQECASRPGSVFQIELEPLLEDALNFGAPAEKICFWSRSQVAGMVGYAHWHDDPVQRQRYFATLDDLARKIFKRIDGCRAGDRPAPSPSEVSSLHLSQPASAAVGMARKVYLAEVADNLIAERAQVARFLEQLGCELFPRIRLPKEPMLLEAAVTEELKLADLFIQLLGPEPQSAIELKQALKLGMSVMQWRDIQLDLNRVADADQQALLRGPLVQSIALSDFKQEIHSELMRLGQRAEHRGPAFTGDGQPLVFINGGRDDSAIVTHLCELFDELGFGYALPLATGAPHEILKDLEDNLIDCDGLVIVYGAIPGQWVREQLRLWRRVQHKRHKPLRALAVYEGPPSQKPPLGMSLPRMHMVDCCQGLEKEKLSQFIQELHQRG